MKILVTGSSGFIGYHLANRLSLLGHDVTGADKVERKNLPFKSLFMNLADWDRVKDLGSYEIIFHFAGHSAGDLSIQNYKEDIDSNLLSTANIIKLAKEAGTKQIIYASSMAVYGDQKVYPVNEEAIPNPHVYYGANKLASEYYLRIASSEKLSTTSLRLFNVYGPGQDVDNLNQGLVSIFIGEILKNNKFVMRGSPDRYRDFIYVDDVVDACLLCMNNPDINREIINICSGKKHTLGELLELIIAKLNKRIPVSYIDPSSFDLNWMHGDLSKAQKLLNFIPKIDLNLGLDLMIDWLKENNRI